MVKNVISISILKSHSHTSEMEKENNLWFTPTETKNLSYFPVNTQRPNSLAHLYSIGFIILVYRPFVKEVPKECFEIMFRAVRFIILFLTSISLEAYYPSHIKI